MNRLKRNPAVWTGSPRWLPSTGKCPALCKMFDTFYIAGLWLSLRQTNKDLIHIYDHFLWGLCESNKCPAAANSPQSLSLSSVVGTGCSANARYTEVTALQCSTTYCTAVQCTTMQCATIQWVHYNAVQCSAVQCIIIRWWEEHSHSKIYWELGERRQV